MSDRSPEELIAHHEAFLRCERADRPLLGFWFGGYYPAEQFPRGRSAWREGQTLLPDDLRLERFAADYENLYRLHRDVDDDFFYVASAYWGVPWLEAMLGCPVVVGPTTCWADPCLYRLDELLDEGSRLDADPWFRCLVRFTQELIELAGGRFPVCPPLLRGPGDAANAMRGAMELVMEYSDDPTGVRRLLEHCTAVRLEAVRRLNEIIPAWEGTYVAGGYPSKVWSTQPIAYAQEDSAAMLSPRLFREFLLPLHRRMCKAASVNFIHLHSACLWPVDILLEDGCYRVLEVNIDHENAGPPLNELLPVFQKIQAAGTPLLLWGAIGPEDWRTLRSELSPAGLSIQPIISHPRDMEPFRSG